MIRRSSWFALVFLVSIAGCKKGDSQAEARLELLTRKVDELDKKVSSLEEVADFVRPIMEQQKAAEAQQQASEPDPNVRFAVDVTGSFSDGPAGAAVTVVKAFDFACPYCERVSGLLDDLVASYDGKVRVVYKNYVVHPDAVLEAHLAACAAGNQGKFKEFKNQFWEKGFRAYVDSRDPSVLGRATIDAIAKDLGLDSSRFVADLEGQACREMIQKEMAEMSNFGVNGTPSFFVNGKFTMFEGPGPFRALIDAELREVERSGVPADQYYGQVVMAGEKKFKSRAAN